MIFECAEVIFSNVTNIKSLRSINEKDIVLEIIKNPDVKSSHREITRAADINIEDNISKDCLYNLVNLYVKVRCYSKVKSIFERYKMGQKNMKSSSLRNNLKKSSKKL